jgi:hypothetical protein
MKPVETVLRTGGKWMRENDGGDESKIHYKFICRSYNDPSPQLIYANTILFLKGRVPLWSSRTMIQHNSGK